MSSACLWCWAGTEIKQEAGESSMRSAAQEMCVTAGVHLPMNGNVITKLMHFQG